MTAGVLCIVRRGGPGLLSSIKRGVNAARSGVRVRLGPPIVGMDALIEMAPNGSSRGKDGLVPLPFASQSKGSGFQSAMHGDYLTVGLLEQDAPYDLLNNNPWICW